MTENCLIPISIINCLYESVKRMFDYSVDIAFDFDDNINYCHLNGYIEDILFEVKDIRNCNIDDDNNYIVTNESIIYLIDYTNHLEKIIADMVIKYSHIRNDWNILTTEFRILSALIDRINTYSSKEIMLKD